jgi:hypothetical protein
LPTSRSAPAWCTRASTCPTTVPRTTMVGN